MEKLTFLNSMLESLLQGANASAVTEIFLILIIASFVIAIAAIRTDRAPRFVSYAPTLLTSLGILGTFVGIIVGLMHFDSSDSTSINASIPQLLDGLKTAFITSLAGTGSTILFKVLTTTWIITPLKQDGEVTGTGPEEILGALLEQNKTLKALKIAISSSEETSLVGQLKLLRTDQTDQHKELVKAVAELRLVISGTEETSLVGQLKLLRNDENDRHRETMRALIEDRETLKRFTGQLWQILDSLAATLHDIKAAIAGAEETSLSSHLQRLQANHHDHHQALMQAVTALRTVIAGTEDTSLVNEWRGLRGEAQSRHNDLMGAIGEDREARNQFATKLWQELDQVGDMLSKAATEQMMSALREVIADFNKNLTEQFGDNFKALDASVQKLVEWQERYRQQLEQMITQYAQGVHAITQIEASVGHIAEESQQIPTTMAQLKSVLLVNQHQIDELSRHLEAFSAMRDKAVEAVPQIREQIDQTVSAVAASVQTASEHYTKLLDLSDTYIEAHDEKTHEQLDAFIKTTDQGINRIREGLENGATAVETTLIQSAQIFEQDLQTLHSRLTNTADVLTAHSDTLRTRLDDALRQINTQTQDLLIRLTEQFGDLSKTLTTTNDQMQRDTRIALSEVHDHTQDLVNTLTGQAKDLTTTLKTAGEQVQRDTRATQEQVTESINQMQKRLEGVLEEVSTAQTRAVSRAVEGVLEEMRKAVSTTGEGVNKQLAAIDQAMQQEISRVMNEMGRALAQIAGQFTTDYQKLVYAMRQIINESGRTEQ